jgi:hypothetical protein
MKKTLILLIISLLFIVKCFAQSLDVINYYADNYKLKIIENKIHSIAISKAQNTDTLKLFDSKLKVYTFYYGDSLVYETARIKAKLEM